MKEINVGIIGFGFMGRAHTYGYKTIPLYYNNLPFHINLVGICDAMPGVAETAKDSLGFEFATQNPEDIFNNPKINCVDICTPNVFHKEGVLGALKAGKNVYCDKPLSASYAESQEIIDVLNGCNVTTQMALQSRCYTGPMRAKELIEEGRLGKIMSFRMCYLHSGSVDRNKPIGWKQDKKMGGGGVLFDLGSHIIDLTYFLLGEFESVNTTCDIMYPERPDQNGNMVKIEADDVAFMTVKMKQGCYGTIEASKVSTGTNDEIRIEIYGEKGAITYNSQNPNYVNFFDNTVPEAPLGGMRGFTAIECMHRYPKPGGSFPGGKFNIGFMRGHVHSLYHYLCAVSEGRPGSPSFEEGAYIQYIMERAYESDQKRAWVQL